MKLLALSTGQLRQALPMAAAIAAMRSAFVALSAGDAQAPQRIAVPVEPAAGVSLLMGAFLPAEGLAAKVVSVFPGNAARGQKVVHGTVLVLDPDTGAPTALCNGTFLTAWRTGAASGAATDLLAREDSKIGALIGSGEQARTQLLAITEVRTLERVRIFSRSRENVARFIAEMQPQVQATLEPAANSAAAIRDADIVCTATDSREPVLDGRLLKRGAHVNAVGSFTLEMREIDVASVERARVFIDCEEAALAEAGDLVAALRQGRTEVTDWTELGRVAARTAAGRRGSQEITLFKSVGHAVQDTAAAARAVAAARAAGLGTEVEI
ncbi:MAG: ornithine cyclodeaminase [Acidobacteriota bacterium]